MAEKPQYLYRGIKLNYELLQQLQLYGVEIKPHYEPLIDQYGVLQPSEIDTFTGYRYYSDENIVECELIKLLKSLDFTLEEIILYKNSLDEEVIKKKKKEIEERIYLLKLKYKRLSILEEELKNQKEFINKTKE